jgi:hypothetical protein
MASQPRSPDVSADSPQVVLVSKDCLDTATTLPPRRQYLTRSKVAASAFARPGMSGKIGPSNSSSSADSKSREAQLQPHPPSFDILCYCGLVAKDYILVSI